MHGDPASWDAGGPHAVSVGVFDGVHLGHKHLFGRLEEGAEKRDISVGLVTFDRHPLTVIAPEHAPPLITSLERRLELFEECGIDTVGVLPFVDRIRTQTPEEFVSEVLIEGLGARLVLMGEDFRFGKDQAGNIEVMVDLGADMGFDVEPIELIDGNGPLSSTHIRSLIAEGDVTGAAEALDHAFELRGRLAYDDAQAGSPNAELQVPRGLAVPKQGVYAVRVSPGGDEWVQGVAYIGARPISGEGRETVVLYLIDRDVYPQGASIRMQFDGRIRDGSDSPVPGESAAQMDRDIAKARRLLG
jgi:riboflavin kinase/FMN adenylyltransferase